ncbi:hypothetical protein Rhopal_000305-T1 [Rhodotorula paludigena]|uniref:Gag protein n=1 Tax=Rhodotorula paludigena TaxID=86838 RepID=A0AAV5GCK1_9BASI|nr:hypothetical protein Rhopal_000305-T1 [Rhodotorula paludigena]
MAGIGGTTPLDFDLAATPATAPTAKPAKPFDGANYHAPEDWLFIAATAHVAPPLTFLNPTSIALSLTNSVPSLAENGTTKFEQEIYRNLLKCDATLSYSEWQAAYAVYESMFPRLFGPASAKLFGKWTMAHRSAIAARFSTRAWPILRWYDILVRRRFWDEITFNQANKSKDGKVAPPTTKVWDDGLFSQAASRYEADPRDILDVFKRVETPAASLVRVIGQALRTEPKHLTKQIDELVEAQKVVDMATIGQGTKGSASPFPSTPSPAPSHSIAASTQQYGQQQYGQQPQQQPGFTSFFPGTLPPQHPSPRLMTPTSVQQHVANPVPSNIRCGMCGSVGNHMYSSCTAYNSALLERRYNGPSLFLKGSNVALCNGWNIGRCSVIACKYGHFCSHCGNSAHGLFFCPSRSPNTVAASNFPPRAPQQPAQLPPPPPPPPPAPAPAPIQQQQPAPATGANATTVAANEGEPASKKSRTEEPVPSMTELIKAYTEKNPQSFPQGE